MQMRKFLLVVVVLLTATTFAAKDTPADGVILYPKPTEATLYTHNFADVTAVASYSGEGEIALWLPQFIEKDSVVIEDKGKLLPHTFKIESVFERGKDGSTRFMKQLAKLSGLPAGEHNFLVRYRTRGLGWNPNYSLILDRPGSAVLRSVPTLTNNVLKFEGATLRLVSGRPTAARNNYSHEGYRHLLSDYERMSRRSRYMPPIIWSEDIREIRILHDIDIPEETNYQLPAQEERVRVDQLLVWDVSKTSERAEPRTRPPVTTIYTLQTETGAPLAEGSVKVYENEVFAGEGSLGRSPYGDTGKGIVVLPGATQVTVEKEEKTEELPATWESRHITILKVANHSKLPARIEILSNVRATMRRGRPGRGRSSRGRLRGGMASPVYTFSEEPVAYRGGIYSWFEDIPPQGEHIISYEALGPLDPAQFLTLHIGCNDSPEERRYLYEEHNSYFNTRDWYRYMDGTSYVIYRLDLQDTLERADMVALMSGNFVVSVATEKDGKPGTFTILARSDIYHGRDIHDQDKPADYYFDVSPYLSRSENNVLYVKFEDGSKQDKGGPALYWLAVYRTPEGFPSRSWEYMRKGVSAPRPRTRR